eukprot:126382-Prorocentrum_minimum.AAC.3
MPSGVSDQLSSREMMCPDARFRGQNSGKHNSRSMTSVSRCRFPGIRSVMLRHVASSMNGGPRRPAQSADGLWSTSAVAIGAIGAHILANIKSYSR